MYAGRSDQISEHPKKGAVYLMTKQNVWAGLALSIGLFCAGCVTKNNSVSVDPDLSTITDDADATVTEFESFQAAIGELKSQGAEPELVAEEMSALADQYWIANDPKSDLAIRRDTLVMLHNAYGDEDSRTAAAKAKLSIAMSRWQLFEEEAVRLAQQAYDTQLSLLGDQAVETADAAYALGLARRGDNDLQGALKLFEELLDTSKRIHGENHVKVADVLTELSGINADFRRSESATDYAQRALEIYRAQPSGEMHVQVARLRNHQANAVETSGLWDEGITLREEALEIMSNLLGADHYENAGTLNGIAYASMVQGNIREAEDPILRGIAIIEATHGTEHKSLSWSLGYLANYYGSSARMVEAVAVQERSLAIVKSSKTPAGQRLAVAGNLGTMYSAMGWTDKALELKRESATFAREQQELPASHPLVVLTQVDLAQNELNGGYPAEAEAIFKRAVDLLETREQGGTDELAQVLEGLGEAQIRQDKYADAVVTLDRAYRMHVETRGEDARTTLRVAAKLSRALLGNHEYGRSLDVAAEGVERLEQKLRITAISDPDFTTLEQLANGGALWAFQSALVPLAQTDPAIRKRAVSYAFKTAQLQKASRTSTRFNHNAIVQNADDALALPANRLQDLMAERRDLEQQMSETLGSDSGAAEEAIRESEQTDAQILEAITALQAVAPHYLDLVSTQSVNLEEIVGPRGSLNDDEALLIISGAGAHSAGIFVSNSTSSAAEIALTDQEAGELVDRLHASTDLSDVAFASDIPDFDFAAASDLYQAIISPHQANLTGIDTLYVIADGPLARVPFNVLVEASEQDGRTPRWLIDQVAVAHLPSVLSLVALRGTNRGASNQGSFLGIGDPSLAGETQSMDLRSFATLRSETNSGSSANSTAQTVCLLAPLPETARELRAIGSTLGTTKSRYLLEENASEPMLSALNTSGELATFDTIAFATHGLITGDGQGGAEPALVMSPPPGCEAITDSHDGLLTASEIASLKVSADWVILSACSTAAADPSAGAEPLSGLAKAFFHAGAQALLVSHWDIESEATSDFIELTFEEASTENWSRTDALRRAQIAFRDTPPTDKPHYAHPAFWGPFALIGIDD